MCGIVGCINKKNPREYIVEGLKILDYRGYDSAGIAFLNDEIQIFKDAGSVDHLNSIIPVGMSGKIAIGHTRWATHGKPSKINSHPHLSYDKKFALVHNGVIENFQDLKAELTEQGIKFVSDTDSEVILNLIALTYSKTKDVLKSINMTMKRLKGSYAIGLIHVGDDRLYVMKNATPLLIGLGESFNLISSDPSPMIEYTNKFIELDDFEYGYIEKDKVALFDIDGRKIEKEFVSKEAELIKHDLNGYKHFMLKEIEEIPSVVKRLTDAYIDDNGFKIDKELLQSIKESDHIIFLGCGTSYHASLVGGRYFEEMLEVPTASYIASEWAFHPMFPGKKPFIVFISQSGETADLIHCLKIVKERNFKSLIITNTKGSTLDRGCDYSMPLYAGVEVAVASTKAYVAQVETLLLLVFAIKNELAIKEELYSSINAIKHLQTHYVDSVKRIAYELVNEKNIYYLGRGYDYYLSLEASLKLKEVSYIHSEGIAGGELKHGPIALIENNTPVVVFITDKATASSMRGNVEEVKSRGAKVFVITTKELSKETDSIVIDDYPSYLSSIIVSTIAFYLAYFVALYKGLNVDKPRNLAKSVTVE